MGTPFASEAFAGSAGTELSAFNAAWSKQNGYTSNGIIGGDGPWFVTSANTTYAMYQHSASPASADYSVFADFTHISSGLNYELGLIGRAAVGAQTFYLLLYQIATTRFRLFRMLAGSQIQLGSEYTYTLTSTTVTPELRFEGTTISAHLGATQMISVTDSDITAAGKAGITTFSSREVGVADRGKIDNWHADDPGGGGGGDPIPPRILLASQAAGHASYF